MSYGEAQVGVLSLLHCASPAVLQYFIARYITNCKAKSLEAAVTWTQHRQGPNTQCPERQPLHTQLYACAYICDRTSLVRTIKDSVPILHCPQVLVYYPITCNSKSVSLPSCHSHTANSLLLPSYTMPKQAESWKEVRPLYQHIHCASVQYVPRAPA